MALSKATCSLREKLLRLWESSMCQIFKRDIVQERKILICLKISITLIIRVYTARFVKIPTETLIWGMCLFTL